MSCVSCLQPPGSVTVDIIQKAKVGQVFLSPKNKGLMALPTWLWWWHYIENISPMMEWPGSYPFSPLTHCYFINFSNMIMRCMYLGHGFMKDFGCPLFTLTSFFLERRKNSSTSKDWRERNIIAVWKDSCLSIKPYSKASTACLCQQVTNVFFISVGFGRFPWKVKRPL